MSTPTTQDAARIIRDAFDHNAEALGLTGEARAAHVNTLTGSLMDLVGLFNRPAPAPAPTHAPARQTFPQPADFTGEEVIGMFQGEAMVGLSWWNDEAGEAKRYGVRCVVNGLTLCAYPRRPDDPHDDQDVVNVDDGERSAGIGDVTWETWGKLRELATDPHDPMGQLMALARRWCSGAPALAIAAD